MTSSVTLTDQLDEVVRRLVETGRYASASEVVRDGLRLVEQREAMRETKLAWLRDAIRDGLKSGPPEPLDFDRIKEEGRRRLVQRASATDGR